MALLTDDDGVKEGSEKEVRLGPDTEDIPNWESIDAASEESWLPLFTTCACNKEWGPEYLDN